MGDIKKGKIMLVLMAAAVLGFGTYTAEKAQDICAPEPISKECFVEALQPITTANHGNYNT